jgi:ABC-2 type transport system ATP-binding protein
MYAIEVENLQRVYGTTIGVLRRQMKEVIAVDGISFQVPQGMLFGMLGPNGAGKTTTVKMLTTLLAAEFGLALIYIALGYALFLWLERKAKAKGTLEVI